MGVLLLSSACGTRLSDDQIAADVATLGSVTGTGQGGGPAGGSTGDAAGGTGGLSGDGSTGGVTGPVGGTGGTTGGTSGGAGSTGGTTGGSSGGAGSSSGGGTSGSSGTTGGSGGRSGTSGSTGTTTAAGGTLLLGNVGDYSGLSSSSTAGSLRGMQVWVQAVNAKGGIGGRKVKLLVADAGGDGQRGKSFVQDFVENKKVVSLVGSAAALSVNGWASYADQKRVPVVGGECGAVYWNEHPMLFNQCPALETSLYGILANGARKAGKGARWANLYCVESPDLCGKLDTLANEKGYAKKAGLTPVFRAGISLGQPDFTSECLNLRNNNVAVVSVFSDANTTQRVARSCSQQNYRPIFLSGSIQVPTNAPTSAGLETVVAMSQVLPFTRTDSPAAQEFQAAMKKYGGDGAIGMGEANGWAAGKLFEKAVALGGGASKDQVIAGLYKMRKETLGGFSTPLTFAPGKPSPDTRCWHYMEAAGGKWTSPNGAAPTCWAGA